MSKPSLHRRGFLRAAAGTAAVAAGAGAFAAPAAAAQTDGHGGLIPRGRIGLQLYSVRDQIQQRGFTPVLTELAAIGYKHIEFAGYTSPAEPDMTVPKLRKLLDDNGLVAGGAHLGLDALLNASTREREFENAAALGMDYVGTASDFPGRTAAEIQAGADRFNESGEVARGYGLKVYQHNHTNEFGPVTDRPGKRRHDLFLSGTDPRYVFLELDILWAFGASVRFRDQLGEFDPLDYVNAAPQRYIAFHVKDGVRDPALTNQYRDVVFGQGELDFRRFFSGLRAPGLPLYFWEQDRAPQEPQGSIWAAETSYDAMVALQGRDY
ncbi:sugar phosphate isomerase/epimerase [Streptomyces sp. NBC_01808]|uniref:sugar phosphate isomerase/epimerase family protein n=1 Tax=Streptomyces sp. NBC_01808 TaxID=2975947 RepID=UPI002DD82651|nr:sugar phosphate isomerase/epimerase [Streptomyces sp. NBC_01808]WSA36653.1 sugar phosphate isomerase/epimerase [Streptomyces sp. NBC_01808]